MAELASKTNIAASPKIPVIYQDDDIIIIDKPPGVVVYPPNTTSHTPSLLDHFRDLINDPLNSSGEPNSRPGVVHRLDRDTSGVMVLARTTAAREQLSAQFAERHITKHYRVLVYGHLKHDHARVELPLARSPHKYTQMVVSRGGKPAALEYSLIHRYTDYDLLDITLETGRTHQIRVQLNYLGHTVVGDAIYGKKGKSHQAHRNRQKSAEAMLPRQFVHAYSLKLLLPSGTSRTFTAPLAKDLVDFLQTLS